MASERKASANRANARKSTGPSSPAGQQRAARNAVRHGLLQAGADVELASEARARSELYCTEDSELARHDALTIAAAIIQGARIARAQAAEIERALEKVDPHLPRALREDLARIGALQRLLALDNYERRSGGALRRQLRKVTPAELAAEKPLLSAQV